MIDDEIEGLNKKKQKVRLKDANELEPKTHSRSGKQNTPRRYRPGLDKVLGK